MINYSLYSEEDLIKGLQNGNTKAFTEIYNRFWKLLFAIAFKHLDSKEGAEEVVQNIFMRLWDRRAEVEIRAVGPYLATACKYSVFKQIAREKLQRESLAGQRLLWEPSSFELESIIHTRFLEQLLASTVDSLPAQCKLVYRLSEEQYLKVPQIAEQLHISPNTARNHLARARQIIRSTLKEAGASMLLF